MASIRDHLTEIYVFVDDWMKKHPHRSHWRTSPNRHPDFTDAETITIALMQGALGVDTLKQTYKLVRDNDREAFAHLPCYKQWVRRLHALTSLVGQIAQAAAFHVFSRYSARLFVLDSKPLPVCKPLRHGRVNLLREEGAYFGKSSAGWFFGFKLHSLIHQPTGVIISSILMPGNLNDRDAALALCLSVDGGLVLADWGYSGPDTFEALYEHADMVRIMPADTGERRHLVSSLRQRIETTFSDLWRRFVDRLFSRSWNGLWNTVKLKICYHNMKLAGLISA